MTKKTPQTFQQQKIDAWADGLFRDCPHGECGKRKRCTGGPRGTMRKHGKPLCRTKFIAAQITLCAAKRKEREDQRTFDADMARWRGR